MTDSNKMINIVYKALEDKKAEDIKIINISKISTISDYFVIANGSNTPHVQSLVDAVSKELDKEGYDVKTVEGGRSATWILLDYVDIVVHIFTKEDRDFYNLERIWRDGSFLSIKDIKK